MKKLLFGIVFVLMLIGVQGVYAEILVTANATPTAVVFVTGANPSFADDSEFNQSINVYQNLTDWNDSTFIVGDGPVSLDYEFSNSNNNNVTEGVLEAYDGLTTTLNLDGGGRKAHLEINGGVSNGDIIEFRLFDEDEEGDTLVLTNLGGTVTYGSLDNLLTSYQTREVTLANITGSINDVYVWVIGPGADVITFDHIDAYIPGEYSATIVTFGDVHYVEGNTYKLLVRVINGSATVGYVTSYISENEVGQSIQASATEVPQTVEIDVTALARLEAEYGLFGLKFRLYSTGTEYISDVGMRVENTQELTFFAQGPSQVEAGSRMRNEWQLVTSVEGVEISDMVCMFESFGNANESAIVLNNSYLDVAYPDFPVTSNTFGVWWTVNESEIPEGNNVEISCNVSVSDVKFSDVVQFVYVNHDKSLWENIAQFIQYFLQLIGITQDTQQLVSGQAEMVDARAGFGEQAYATTFLTYADMTVDVNASCYLDVWYPNSTQWLDEQGMTQTGADGRYLYGLIAPQQEGSYQMRSFCNGTGLQNRTRYAYANFEVFDNVIMQMIT